jgi:alkylation response protein AidB-like acyl-CoA dehydrogenase
MTVTPQMPTAKPSTDYRAIAAELVAEFAATAAERDRTGGTALAERDRLRQSGLLSLIVPQRYGGLGATWSETLQIIRQFAAVDSSLAHLFAYQQLGAVAAHIFGSPEQRDHYYRATATHNWFWANAFNPLDRRTVLTAEGEAGAGRFRLNGTKTFCSGSVDSDLLPVSVVYPGQPNLWMALVPTKRLGVQVNGDWDNIGQRQTDSGSVTFTDVVVEPEELMNPAPNGSAFKTIRACLTQAVFTNIYLGIAQGALAAAKGYTTTNSRPWIESGVERAVDDPYTLQSYGNMHIDLQAATLLADRAGELVQQAWAQEEALTAAERGDCAIAVSTAKAFITKAGLEITSKIFEVMGTRSTAAGYGFDRYWRNLRVFSLHDPVEYKIRTVGRWYLTDTYPQPDLYT